MFKDRAATMRTRLRVPPAALAVMAIFAIIGSTHTSAADLDENVAKNCIGDYLAYCSRHDPNSAETGYCMEAHREQLSKRCVKALLSAGLVPKKYLTEKRLADDE